jgi:beta-lactam-binding protein with PASTA domain
MPFNVLAFALGERIAAQRGVTDPANARRIGLIQGVLGLSPVGVVVGSELAAREAAAAAAAPGGGPGTTRSVQVPPLSRLPQTDAAQVLQDNQLTLGTVSTADAPDEPGTVTAQDPAANTYAPVGSAVNIVVSSGVAVPSVVGQPEDDAEAALDDARLVPVIRREPNPADAGQVFGQDPKAGTRVAGNSTVTLQVSSGPGTQVPRVVGMDYQEAGEALRAVNLYAVVEPVYSTAPEGEVIKQDPVAGVIVDPNTTLVTLTVSAGKERPGQKQGQPPA